jgi:hypothetical protein
VPVGVGLSMACVLASQPSLEEGCQRRRSAQGVSGRA